MTDRFSVGAQWLYTRICTSIRLSLTGSLFRRTTLRQLTGLRDHNHWNDL